MLYNRIVLHLLEDRPQLHEQLRKERKLLATLNRLAGELRSSHKRWKKRLTTAAVARARSAARQWNGH
jgi:hypothetical protein